MKMKVLKRDDKVTHIALSGKLDLDGEAEIRDELRNLLTANRTSFLVDMSDVSYLASLGIRLLFSSAKTLAVQGKKMVVLKPQPFVEETLLSSGTVKLIPISHDEAEAMNMALG
jgi:anti-sigma B factor antagonist